MIKFGTAFSGIGAPEQALRQAHIPHEVVFACEIDPYVRATYIHNYGCPTHFPSDITTVQRLPNLDVFVFGSPCQAFSTAGRQEGLNDLRAVLALKTLRLIQANPPNTVVFENVKGLVRIDDGEILRHILKQLEAIGYHWHYDVLNALDYGLPQLRERLFIVATYKKGFRFPTPPYNYPSLREMLTHCPYDPEVYASNSFLAKPKVQERMNNWDKDHINCITSTIFRKGSSGEYIGYVAAVYTAIGEARIPTVDECVKLFGFSPSFSFPSGIATGRQYKMLANSMAVPVVGSILQKICS